MAFSFESPLAKPVDEEVHEVGPPTQTPEGEEYICGNSGPAFEGANPGRNQDESRADEHTPAIGCSRYIGQ